MDLTRSELRKKAMTILYQINVYDTNKVKYDVEDIIQDVLEIDNEFVRNMVYGVVTYKNTIDDLANKYLNKWTIDRLGNTDQAIIRMGIYELMYTDTPNIVVINEAVELAKEISEKDGKLVNGILRNYLNKEQNIEVNFRNKIDELAFNLSFEPWMIRMLIKQYGESEAIRILEELNNTPGVTVRVNNIKADYEDVFEELEAQGYEVEEGEVCPEAISITGGKAIEKNQAFIDGKITVQDESAMLVAPLLDIEDNLTVIDLCCAPGGKTTHIGELLNNTGKVLAFDLYPQKLELVRENAERLGITNIDLGEMDATKLNVNLIGLADRVLIDVPCSGIGIIRKKPEIKWTKKRNEIKELIEIQRKIMENAWEYLKKGGIMVYSTCTVNKEENQENITWFLNKHKDAKIEKIFVGREENLRYDELGTLTIFPNQYMDGFFVTKIKKC